LPRALLFRKSLRDTRGTTAASDSPSDPVDRRLRCRRGVRRPKRCWNRQCDDSGSRLRQSRSSIRPAVCASTGNGGVRARHQGAVQAERDGCADVRQPKTWTSTTSPTQPDGRCSASYSCSTASDPTTEPHDSYRAPTIGLSQSERVELVLRPGPVAAPFAHGRAC